MHIKIKTSALRGFFGYKDQQRTTDTPRNPFKDTSTMVTQLTCMSETFQALKYDCQFAFHFLQTDYFDQLCIPTFKQKHFPRELKH